MSAETVANWIALLDHLYPPAHAQDWDAPGLQVGDPTQSVSGVYITLDITEAVILDAVAQGCDLIIAHHPLLFRPLTRLSPATASGRLALLAAQLGVSIYAAHTNFDARPDTTSATALTALGITEVTPLADTGDDRALGLIGALAQPTPLMAVFTTIRDTMPSPLARLCAKQPNTLVQHIASVGGSGASLMGAAISAGADLLITGDVSHHDALDALTQGLAIIDAGHHPTEYPAMALVARHVQREGPSHGCLAPVVVSTVNTDPWANTPLNLKG